VSWISGASDLVSTFKKLGGAGTSAYSGDWLGLGANLGAAAGNAAAYASKQSKALADALKNAGTKVLPTPTAILDVAMLALVVVDFLNGFGAPNSGAAVSTAADKLDLFMKQLDAGCVPDARDWSGAAADAYVIQNTILKGLAESMKDLDKQLKDLVANQGNEVQTAHNCIAITSLVLTAAQRVAVALYLIPVVGPEISCAWQIIAAFGACATVFAFEMLTLSNSMSISQQVDAVALEYIQLGKDAEVKLAGTFGQIDGKGAEQTSSKVASFTAISDGMSAFSGRPTVASLANTSLAREGASPAQRAWLDAASETRVDASADLPATTGDGATPPTLAFTPPTLSQINQASGQLAKMSGHVSQHMNLMNQTTGQVQSVAQMGQQGQGAAAPAEKAAEQSATTEEAALAGDVEGAGAGAGTEAGERAPIDVAEVGAEQELDRPGRVL
jgi:EspA/EspE family